VKLTRIGALSAASGIALSLLLAGCGGNGGGDAASGGPSTIDLTVNIDSCGSAWSAPDGGRLTFAVTNAFYSSMDVFLTNAANGAYIGEYEGVGTGVTLDQSVTLGNGSYRFVCFPNDEAPVTGPTTVISQAAAVTGTTPQLQPVSNADLIQPSLDYKKWISSRLPTLHRQVVALAADVRAGSTAKAKADWLTAHLTYETLGAAYDAFSSGDTDFDGDINGAPASGVDPATDKDLTGFHKLEALLWTGAPAKQLTPVADDLATAVDKLIKAFPTLNIQPNDLPLRAHEIVENAIQFELNGYTDAGSHTNLATVWANLSGAQEALKPLEALMEPRYADFGATEQLLASTKALVLSFKRGGSWPALSSLSESDRARLNGAFQDTVEHLAPIAAIGDIREVVPQ
jgi:iron uptake system component EfeO